MRHGDEVFGVIHFGKGEMEGEGGFGTLVGIDAIVMKAVAAASGAGVVEAESEVVAAKEPFESTFGFFRPRGILGVAEGFEAGGNHGLGFDGLLIEIGVDAVFDTEAVAADGTEMAGLGFLQRGEPGEGFESDLKRFGMGHPLAAENQCLTESGVVIGGDVLKPRPVFGGAVFPKGDEFVREDFACGMEIRTVGKLAKVFVDAKDGESPSAW